MSWGNEAWRTSSPLRKASSFRSSGSWSGFGIRVPSKRIGMTGMPRFNAVPISNAHEVVGNSPNAVCRRHRARSASLGRSAPAARRTWSTPRRYLNGKISDGACRSGGRSRSPLFVSGMRLSNGRAAIRANHARFPRYPIPPSRAELRRRHASDKRDTRRDRARLLRFGHSSRPWGSEKYRGYAEERDRHVWTGPIRCDEKAFRCAPYAAQTTAHLR